MNKYINFFELYFQQRNECLEYNNNHLIQFINGSYYVLVFITF